MNTSTTSATSKPTSTASCWIEPIALSTNTDWSKIAWMRVPGGAEASISGNRSRTARTSSTAEAPPSLISATDTALAPSMRATLVCSAPPSRTEATSRT